MLIYYGKPFSLCLKLCFAFLFSIFFSFNTLKYIVSQMHIQNKCCWLMQQVLSNPVDYCTVSLFPCSSSLHSNIKLRLKQTVYTVASYLEIILLCNGRIYICSVFNAEFVVRLDEPGCCVFSEVLWVRQCLYTRHFNTSFVAGLEHLYDHTSRGLKLQCTALQMFLLLQNLYL